MGKPCVAGCEALSIDTAARTLTIGDVALREGDLLTIDGGSGRVIVGAVPLVPPAIDENFETILGWADDFRRLRVRANADTPADAAKAREFGAEGHRPLPHRAHVHGSGPAPRRAGDDPRRGRARPPGGPRPAPSRPAGRLRGDLRGDGRLSRHDPAPRPAAPRVPPFRGGGDVRDDAPPDRAASRGQPDAGHARLPPRPPVARDLRDAGARDRPGGARGRRSHAARHRVSRSCTRSSGSPRSSADCAS